MKQTCAVCLHNTAVTKLWIIRIRAGKLIADNELVTDAAYRSLLKWKLLFVMNEFLKSNQSSKVTQCGKEPKAFLKSVSVKNTILPTKQLLYFRKWLVNLVHIPCIYFLCLESETENKKHTHAKLKKFLSIKKNISRAS